MQIKYLKLLNFRNHKNFKISFKKTNLLLGTNGAGKTSVLEAIFLLSTSKSPRTSKNNDLILWSKLKSYLEIVLLGGEKEKKIIRLELCREKNGQKTFSFDGVVSSPKNIIGLFKTVYFSPETLLIINGSPAERRRFIDILLSQISPKYLNDLIEYKKILVNRNRILKEIVTKRSGKDEIIFWDMKLIEVGSKIMRSREEAVLSLSKTLDGFHQEIIKDKEKKLKINYHPSFSSEGYRDIESAFTERLAAEFSFELKYGSTLYGPHRDDLRFSFEGRDAASFCSRGEIRSIIIALKLAEAGYIKEKTDTKPVILLDDIFSELDEKRGRALEKLVLNNYQVVITSTENKLGPKLKIKKRCLNQSKI